MTTSTMPQRVMALAGEKGIDWNVFRNGFDAHLWRDAGLKVSAETNAAFLKADDESWCYRNERTLAWIRSLKARGFKIGILTNMAPKFAREHFESVFADFISLADAMVISGDEGIVKPSREIYDLLRGRIALPAGSLCFVDDLEKNVAAARAAGWQAIRFMSNGQVEADFERLAAP